MQPTHVPGLEIYDSYLKKKEKKKGIWSIFVILKMWQDSYFYWSLSIPWRAVRRLSCLCKISSTMWGPLENEVSSSLKEESTWQQGVFEELSLTSISESRQLYMNQQKFVFNLMIWFSSHFSESVEKPLRSQWCINRIKMKNRAGGIL